MKETEKETGSRVLCGVRLRRVSLDLSRRLPGGGLVSFHISPSGCLRMRWADPAADRGFWVFAAELPLQVLSPTDGIGSSNSRNGPSFSLRREGLF